MRHPSWIALLFFLSSCTCSYLSIQTNYLSRENLASFNAETPDPALNYPSVGQQLILSWQWLPKGLLALDDLHLEAKIRFSNRKEVCLNIPINSERFGTYVYPIINEDFFETGGILTYKVQLVGADIIWEEWRHQIWTELIVFDESYNEESASDDSPQEAPSNEVDETEK